MTLGYNLVVWFNDGQFQGILARAHVLGCRLVSPHARGGLTRPRGMVPVMPRMAYKEYIARDPLDLTIRTSDPSLQQREGT